MEDYWIEPEYSISEEELEEMEDNRQRQEDAAMEN